MREAVRGADDKGVEGVATVQADSAGGRLIGRMRSFGEVRRPGRLGHAEGFTVFVGVIGIGADFFGVGKSGAVVGVVGRRGSDAHPELYFLSEPAAQRIGNRGT